VLSSASPVPGFGQADLSNCELEQIHLAGSIRPFGVLLVVREPDLTIIQASANGSEWLRREGGLLGLHLGQLGGDLVERLRNLMREPLNEIPAAVRCRVETLDFDLDGLLHRHPGGGLIVELTASSPPLDLSGFVCDALRSVSATASLGVLADESARIFKELLGYDRVMVYRFDEQGHGEVFAESREPELEPLLGNRYPASDIPQIARRLYVRNRIRVLEDVEYRPVPLTPRRCPATGEHLDMSLCYLRSMSPIHIQYLKNMGVSATLVASLLVGGRLWGLISCHHYSPRSTQYELRVASELLAEAVSTRISALQSFAQTQAELSVRRLEQRMIDAISRSGDWEHALFDNPQALLQPLSASGAALLCDGRTRTAGSVPGTQRLRAIGDWLDERGKGGLVATSSLGADAPAFADLGPEVSGLLAVPLSSCAGEYLVWFRPERVHTLTWGGNPYKAVELGDDPSQLSPRRSFAKWYQLVEGTSDPWTPDDLTTGRLIGESVADVIQQFRSLRVLIARNQLIEISGKVRQSAQPVVIADADGAIVVTNEAFDALLAVGPWPRGLADLPALFRNRSEVAANLDQLMARRQIWRGEVQLAAGPLAGRPFMVRGDPVLSSPDVALGFVLLLTDLGDRKAAEEARRRFQVSVVERHRMVARPLEHTGDLRRRDLLASLVGNAQLAALEITDGPDLDRVPEMLESIQASVDRTTELLEHLLWYSTRRPSDGAGSH
jgi:light-regulated signal transduction histidine kinase (bacteriophytochrome)